MITLLTAAGVLIVGLLGVLIAYLALWRRHRPVFWFALALIVVGLGYLASTGALADIANMILGGAPFRTPTITPTP
jgi:multisubunit Na+/H+ antiporter MnhB subunit